MAHGNNGAQITGSGRRWAVIAGIFVVVVIAAILFQVFRPLRIRVTTTMPTRQDIVSSITSNGKIEPIQNSEAHPPIGTTVKQVFAREGERVRKGQVLVQLDDSDARAQLAKATADLRAAESSGGDVQVGNATTSADLSKAQADRDQAQRNLQALQRLQQRGAASQAEVTTAREKLDRANADLAVAQQKAGKQSLQIRNQSAEANVANARAGLNLAQQIVRDMRITAPFDGIVYSIPVRQGVWVNPADIVLQMADLSKVHVRTFVDEPEIGHLQVGQKAIITWDALPGRTWQGQVDTVPSTVVNRGTRVVGELLVSVNNQDRTLLPNVNVGVTIMTANHPNALVLPREAVHEEDGKNYIYVVKPNKHLDRREVQLGVANLTHVEIAKGISEGETVAVNSLSPTPLRNDVLVKVVEQQ